MISYLRWTNTKIHYNYLTLVLKLYKATTLHDFTLKVDHYQIHYCQVALMKLYYT